MAEVWFNAFFLVVEAWGDTGLWLFASISTAGISNAWVVKQTVLPQW